MKAVELSRRVGTGLGVVLLVVLASIGGVSSGRRLMEWMFEAEYPEKIWQAATGRRIPTSVSPGGPRLTRAWPFILDESNSIEMKGLADEGDQRWLDMAGNAYSRGLVERYTSAVRGPVVRLRIEPRGDTLRGRIEGHRLKPNFAYQVKLKGVFEHRRAFEAIGYAGRWKFPGRQTNFTDGDYRRSWRKHRAEAYLFFDFLLTDARGSVVRDFELNHSLHVLWNAARQRDDARSADMVPVWVDASDPAVYVRPKGMATLELIWAEREKVRYRRSSDTIHLPPGRYDALLTLTEESFHDHGEDGGWWATVFEAPVSFVITAPKGDEKR